MKKLIINSYCVVLFYFLTGCASYSLQEFTGPNSCLVDAIQLQNFLKRHDLTIDADTVPPFIYNFKRKLGNVDVDSKILIIQYRGKKAHAVLVFQNPKDSHHIIVYDSAGSREMDVNTSLIEIGRAVIRETPTSVYYIEDSITFNDSWSNVEIGDSSIIQRESKIISDMLKRRK